MTNDTLRVSHDATTFDELGMVGRLAHHFVARCIIASQILANWAVLAAISTALGYFSLGVRLRTAFLIGCYASLSAYLLSLVVTNTNRSKPSRAIIISPLRQPPVQPTLDSKDVGGNSRTHDRSLLTALITLRDMTMPLFSPTKAVPLAVAARPADNLRARIETLHMATP